MLTVKGLKNRIKDLPDDMPLSIQFEIPSMGTVVYSLPCKDQYMVVQKRSDQIRLIFEESNP